jgi:predicted O-methyltransferase YrrM
VVEVGSDDPAAAWWVVSSMATGGTLTIVSQSAAAITREEVLGHRSDIRVRTIPGTPEDVLGRLSDGGYELMVVRGAAAGDRTLREEAIRLLRPGAVLIVLDLADGTADGRSHALVRDLADDPRFHVSVVPAGAGVALARLAPSR